MDNKITKKRLYDFLSYEWIVIIIAVVLSIFVWEFVYGVTRVKLTPGQEFRTYYDAGINGVEADAFDDILASRGTFSYDVLEVTNEGLAAEYDVLDVRLGAYQGDVIYTHKVTNEDNPYQRAKSLIDKHGMYDLEVLLEDAKAYLRSFLKDGITANDAEFDFENLSKQKIEAGFAKRMEKDNRVRKKKDYNEYLKKEYQRIEKLCKDVADYEYFLENAPYETFYRYTRYEQLVEKANAKDSGYSDYHKREYGKLYQAELDANRVDCVYGINMEMLTGGSKNVSQYISILDQATAKDTILCVFNLKEHQPDLQYETISFIVENVRMFSDILG